MRQTPYRTVLNYSVANHLTFKEALEFLEEQHNHSLTVNLKLHILDAIKINNTPISIEDAIEAIIHASNVVKDIEVSYKGISYKVSDYMGYDDKNLRKLLIALQWFIEN